MHFFLKASSEFVPWKLPLKFTLCLTTMFCKKSARQWRVYFHLFCIVFQKCFVFSKTHFISNTSSMFFLILLKTHHDFRPAWRQSFFFLFPPSSASLRPVWQCDERWHLLSHVWRFATDQGVRPAAQTEGETHATVYFIDMHSSFNSYHVKWCIVILLAIALLPSKRD